MKTNFKTSLLLFGAVVIAAAFGTQLGKPATAKRDDSKSPTTIIEAPAVITSSVKIEATTVLVPKTLAELERSWTQARTREELEPIAQALAEQNTAESVKVLLDGIGKIKEWPVRAALAKNLRAVSSTETLQALIPALLNNYGRGNTILNEISDAIARLAQSETVEDLSALHWQAAVQAGQGHKVLRTVACIRNPAAIHGLMKMAAHDESPAMVAAAVEALKAMNVKM